MAAAVATANVPALGAMSLVAALGVLLPFHPFDYLYNHGLRQVLHRPALPPRSKQLKFTCVVATLWMWATIVFFASGLALIGYALGGMLVFVAFLVSTTDFCIPSTIYNFVFSARAN